MVTKRKKTTKTAKKTAKKTSTSKPSKAKSKPIAFTKMHGIGNDIIILDCIKGTAPANPSHISKKLCNRRTGVGADQVMLLSKSRKYDFAVRIFNADGSEAESCGNGLRCIARFIKDNRYSVKKELQIDTIAGPRNMRFMGKNVQVDMGDPIMKGKEIPVNLSGRIVNRPLKMEMRDFRITCLSMGNPHCIIFQENLSEFDLEHFGPMIETYHIFPKKVNVSFVNVLSKNELQVRVWERGAGETLGCGTAACAANVASVLNGFTERKVTVQMPGGKLDVEWNQKDNHIYLRGPAELVCKGEVYL